MCPKLFGKCFCAALAQIHVCRVFADRGGICPAAHALAAFCLIDLHGEAKCIVGKCAALAVHDLDLRYDEHGCKLVFHRLEERIQLAGAEQRDLCIERCTDCLLYTSDAADD